MNTAASSTTTMCYHYHWYHPYIYINMFVWNVFLFCFVLWCFLWLFIAKAWLMKPYICDRCVYVFNYTRINCLWLGPGDAIWRYGSWSPLLKVMACCLLTYYRWRSCSIHMGTNLCLRRVMRRFGDKIFPFLASTVWYNEIHNFLFITHIAFVQGWR